MAWKILCKLAKNKRVDNTTLMKYHSLAVNQASNEATLSCVIRFLKGTISASNVLVSERIKIAELLLEKAFEYG